MSYPAALKAAFKAYPFGLFVGCLVGTLGFTLLSLLERPAAWHQWLAAPVGAVLIALFAIGFAAVPSLVLGVPAYAWLLHSGRATRGAAAALGLLAGAAAGAWGGWPAALVTSGYGACIGYFTHEAWRADSNNSSKPTPLRGAA